LVQGVQRLLQTAPAPINASLHYLAGAVCDIQAIWALPRRTGASRTYSHCVRHNAAVAAAAALTRIWPSRALFSAFANGGRNDLEGSATSAGSVGVARGDVWSHLSHRQLLQACHAPTV